LVATCALLGKNRQVYYRKKQCIRDHQAVAQQVIALVNKERIRQPRLGGRKLYVRLKEPLHTLKVGRDKLFTILRANHLLVPTKRCYHVTTDSHHRFKKHKDLVSELTINRPEQVLVSDITYIGKRNNHCYLSLVTDAYSKKIMGYDLSNSLAAPGVKRALKMAVKNRTYKHNSLIHHSDRGSQYCSTDYQKMLRKANITTSMTESYDPYKNAVAERINGILKQEFLLEKYADKTTVLDAYLKEVVETYNLIRPHFSNYYLTPQEMHMQAEVKMRTYKRKKLNENSLVEPLI
jgi:transposase InsO family protein